MPQARQLGHGNSEASEDIVRLQEQVGSIQGKIERIDTELGEATKAINLIHQRGCSLHMQTSVARSRFEADCAHRYELIEARVEAIRVAAVGVQWRDKVDADLKSLEKARNEMSGGTSVALKVGQLIAVLLTLAMSMWSVSLAHQALQYTRPEIPVQHRGK